jgi:glycerate 2-kinase
VPDASTCADALAICRRYGIALPPAARAGLESGAFETPKPGDARFAGHEVHMIATPQQSLEAAAALARAAGVRRTSCQRRDRGREPRGGQGARGAGARGGAARPAVRRPCVILSGGETTVTVRSKGGRGGPGHRVPARLRDRAAGRARRARAGGRHRRHRRHRGQRRRHRHARHAGARPALGPEARPSTSTAATTPTTLLRALGDLVVPGPTFTNVNDFRLAALVQTAVFLPMFLLALPAGVLADTTDRRA